MNSQAIFSKLWEMYSSKNPEVQKIHDCFTRLGETVINDHIAFRTFDDPRVNIDVLARPFLLAGYVQKGFYIFEDKHLVAKHFELPGQPEAPRVFISQLQSRFFSTQLQEAVKSCVDQIPDIHTFGNELIFAGNLWGTPSYSLYEKLRSESEYAAWVYVYGFCANHFTVSINHLNKLQTIQQVNQFLKDNGFVLNSSGGEVKGTPDELLEQSSTKAGILGVNFIEGISEIPSCYYEFAFRYPDTDGNLYNGFIAKSADKIFESTDFYKK